MASSTLAYSQDDVLAMLAVFGPLPADLLDFRLNSGIWWRQDALAAMFDNGTLKPGFDQAEADVLMAHPTGEPTTKPLLPFPHFTIDEFIAFEDCAHVLRPMLLVQRAHVEEALSGHPFDSYIGVRQPEFDTLKSRDSRAAELVEALLGRRHPGKRVTGVIDQRADEIRAELARMGMTPETVPKIAGRNGGVKKRVRDRLQPTALFGGHTHHFDTAWKRVMSGYQRPD